MLTISYLGQRGSGILAWLAFGIAQPVGRPLGCDQVDDEEGGQEDGLYARLPDGKI